MKKYVVSRNNSIFSHKTSKVGTGLYINTTIQGDTNWNILGIEKPLKLLCNNP